MKISLVFVLHLHVHWENSFSWDGFSFIQSIFQANEVSDKTVATCFLGNENDVIHTEAVTPLDDYIQSNESTNHR